MKLPPHLSVRDNHLYIGDFDTNSLSQAYQYSSVRDGRRKNMRKIP